MTHRTALRVLHPITRMVLGGAQENTLITVDQLNHAPQYAGRYQADIVCGPDLGSEGELLSEARRRNLQYAIIPGLANPIRPHRDSQALLRLYRHIKRHNYTIVHTHSTKAGLLGRMAAKMAGVPVIVHTVHGWGFHAHSGGNQQRVLVPLERAAARLTDRIITVTSNDIDKGLSLKIGRPEQYVTIRSGIELNKFGCVADAAPRIRQELGIDPTTPIVGTVTRLSPQKAPIDFVRVARIVADAVPEAKFVIVGDGPLRDEVMQRITAESIADRVILTGVRRDVPELMSAFDVFVLTSLWEGLPRVLPQAMATGLPVVATAADGSMEIVEHGKNGYLAPPGAIEELAAHIVTLLHNPAQGRTMGSNGHALSKEYSEHLMVRQIAELYQELLQEKGIT